MVKKKFSNAKEVNMFSNSNVNFYTILSHVLDWPENVFVFFSKISLLVNI